jgi:hypothetical protein
VGRLQKLRVQGRHEDYKYTLASHGLAGGAIEGAMTTSPTPPRELAITLRTGRTGA